MVRSRPVTKKESFQYDRSALAADTQKRENNIKIFQDTIAKEEAAIAQNRYIISQIDPQHPDVKKLEENIEKMKTNIKIFEEAIKNEHEEIKRDNAMITIIDRN